MKLQSCWPTVPSVVPPEQVHTYQTALISLLILPLCTLILHHIVSTYSHADTHNTNTDNAPRDEAQQLSFFAFLVGFVTVILWLGALTTWSISLASVSPVLRNNALLYGILASNALPLCLLFVKRTTISSSGWSLESLIGLMLWPMYLGMLIGTFGVGSALTR
jgi:hypothetical protein